MDHFYECKFHSFIRPVLNKLSVIIDTQENDRCSCTRDKELQFMEIRIIFLSFLSIIAYFISLFFILQPRVQISCFRGRGSWRG